MYLPGKKDPNTQISGKGLKEVEIPGMGSSRSRSLVETGAFWGWAAWDGMGALWASARACVRLTCERGRAKVLQIVFRDPSTRSVPKTSSALY